jgi:hypothetical protein
MKRLLLILILTFSFQSLAKTDDISNFEIEGMSIGDSLSDFFEKNLIDAEINDKASLFYKNKLYVQIGVSYKKAYRLNIKSRRYDDLSIVLKPNDNTYKIYSIGGRIFCKDIKICKSKKKDISIDLKTFFSDDVEIENINKNHNADPSGNSKSFTSYFNFKNSNAYALVAVYNWSDKFEKEKNYPDNLKIMIVGEEFGYFLNNVQYN